MAGSKKTTGPPVVDDSKKGKYWGMTAVARMFDITPNTIRKREREGIIRPIPRNRRNCRRIPTEWVADWLQNGFPGPPGGPKVKPVNVPDAMRQGGNGGDQVSTGGADGKPVKPVALDIETDLDDDLTVTPGEIYASLRQPRVEDEVYRGDSERIRRLRDDLAEKRLLIEERRLDRELSQIGSSSQDGALKEIIHSQTELIKALIVSRNESAKPEGLDLAGALGLIQQFRGILGPEKDGPGAKLLSSLNELVLSRVGDRLFETPGGASEPSLMGLLQSALPAFLQLIAKAPPVPGDRTSTVGNGETVRRVQPVAGTGESSPGHPEERVTAVDDIVRMIPGAQGVDDESQVDLMGVIESLFDVLLGSFQNGVSPQEAAEAVQLFIGPDPVKPVRRVIFGHHRILVTMAKALNRTEMPTVIFCDDPNGAQWFEAVHNEVVRLYAEGGDNGSGTTADHKSVDDARGSTTVSGDVSAKSRTN